jgi:hypothetical protein
MLNAHFRDVQHGCACQRLALHMAFLKAIQSARRSDIVVCQSAGYADQSSIGGEPGVTAGGMLSKSMFGQQGFRSCGAKSRVSTFPNVGIPLSKHPGYVGDHLVACSCSEG